MNKIFLLFLFLLITQTTTSFAQSSQDNKKQSQFFLGGGLGLDYGGLGLKFEYQPIKYVGAFVGLGYNVEGYGINLGASFYPFPNQKLQPLVHLLYGYNAVLITENMPELNKTYYGISPGIGGLLKTGKRDNKLSFAIFLPIRSQTFHDDYEAWKVNPNVRITQEILPFTFSIGFNWKL